MAISIEALRSELVAAIDDVLGRYGTPTNGSPAPSPDDIAITRIEPLEDEWTYRWPTTTETYTEGAWYDVAWPSARTRVLVAWCMRRAWGKERGRIVIFGQFGPDSSRTYYPWAEFVEADDGAYVADVPDPKAPRSLLKDGAPMPATLNGATIRRNDECFESVQNGPSLRLAVARNDEEAMIRHAHWVATLRGRLNG